MAAGRDDELWKELVVMAMDAQQSGEEVRGLRMQFANALILEASATPAAPESPEDRGQKFPHSPDFSGSD